MIQEDLEISTMRFSFSKKGRTTHGIINLCSIQMNLYKLRSLMLKVLVGKLYV